MKISELRHNITSIIPQIDQDMYYLKCLLRKNDILEISDYRQPEVRLLTSAPTKQEKVRQTLILHLSDMLLDCDKLYLSGVINGSKGHRYCLQYNEEIKILNKLDKSQTQYISNLKSLKINEKTICLVFDLDKFFFLEILPYTITFKTLYDLPRNLTSFTQYFIRSYKQSLSFLANNLIVMSNSIFIKDMKKIFIMPNTYFLESTGNEDIILSRPNFLYKDTNFVNLISELKNMANNKILATIIKNLDHLVFGLAEVTKYLSFGLATEIYIAETQYNSLIFNLDTCTLPIYLVNLQFMTENNLTNICAAVRYKLNG